MAGALTIGGTAYTARVDPSAVAAKSTLGVNTFQAAGGVLLGIEYSATGPGTVTAFFKGDLTGTAVTVTMVTGETHTLCERDATFGVNGYLASGNRTKFDCASPTGAPPAVKFVVIRG